MLNLKTYSVLITIVALIELYLLLTIEPKIEYRDRPITKSNSDTTFTHEPVAPDSNLHIKPNITFHEIEPDVDSVPDIEVDPVITTKDYDTLVYACNLFEHGIIHKQNITSLDFNKYILTKPFEAIDTVINKKQDTIVTVFSFSIQKPGIYDHYYYYSPDVITQINTLNEVESNKNFTESEWFRWTCIGVSFVSGLYIGAKAVK